MLFNLATAMGIAESATTMSATPETTGVITRFNFARNADMPNCSKDAAITNIDIKAKPP